MVNLLGATDRRRVRVHGAAELLVEPGVHLHLYGKERERPGRKMGHITATGADAAAAAERTLRAAAWIRFGEGT